MFKEPPGMLIRALALLSFLLPAQLLASGTATLGTASGDTLTLEWLDTSSIRVSGGPIVAGHVLIRDGRAYSVIQQAGQSLVLELRTLATMIPASMRRDMLRHSIFELKEIRPLGKRESRAGITGDLHVLDFVNAEGEAREIEVVLARDALAREFTEVFEAFARILARDIGREVPAGEELLAERLKKSGHGLLRVGGDVRVEALQRARHEPARFELPPRAFRLPGMLDEARHETVTPSS
jgi:hypothetical protein